VFSTQAKLQSIGFNLRYCSIKFFLICDSNLIFNEGESIIIIVSHKKIYLRCMMFTINYKITWVLSLMLESPTLQ
jgi:hypothetical protein